MPLALACPACGKKLKAPDGSAGKRVRCPHCGDPFTVTASAATSATSGTSPPTRPPDTVSAAESTANAPAVPTEVTAYTFLRPAQGPGELGRLGPYRVIKVLGAGGMGVVFQAEDTRLQRQVALKAMLPHIAASPAARERFLREARTAAAIEHDHVVTVYQVDEDRDVPYLAMPLLRGESLEDRLHRERRLPAAEAVRIAREVADGLAAAHERGLIHRDIKPANVWLEQRGTGTRVKLLDFGLARAAAADARLTQSGAILGTPAYMAPEQAAGKAVDHRCDLFSLGCVLYRMVTGALPFPGEDAMSVLMALALNEPKPVAELCPDAPPALADLIKRLLAKDPAGRPASARAVVAELQAIEAGPRAPARAPDATAELEFATAPLVQPPRRRVERGAGLRTPPLWRRPWVIAAAAGVLGVIVLAAAFVIRLTTAEGTVVIESDDKDVQVTIKDGGTQVAILDPKSRQEVVLKTGTYQAELKQGGTGLTLETDRFTLKRGGREVVRVYRVPAPVAVRPPARAAPARPPADEPVPAPRRPPVAEAPPARPAEPEAPAPPAGAPPGARVLFDGKDLGGWVTLGGEPAAWKVQDGYVEVVPGRGDIMTRERFGPDVQLHAEFWLPFMPNAHGQARANSGIFIQGRYELQVLDSYHNDTFAKGECGSLYGLVGTTRKACRPPGQWQTYDVEFHAPRVDAAGRVTEKGQITVVLNGITVIDRGEFDRATGGAMDTRLGLPGPLRLQDHGARVRFRNLWVVEKARRAADDWQPLFNGTDLAGWRVVGGRPDAWQVEGGALVTSGRNNGWLMTEAEYTDFEVRLEYRLGPRANSGLALRSPLEGDPAYVGMELQLLDDAGYPGLRPVQYTGAIYDLAAPARRAARPTGEWNHLWARVEGRRVTVRLNGELVQDVDLDDYRGQAGAHPGILRSGGHLGLQSLGGQSRFLDVYVKPLR